MSDVEDENIDVKFTKGKIPLSQMSVYSMVPTSRSTIPPEFTYFNTSAKEVNNVFSIVNTIKNYINIISVPSAKIKKEFF